jgi:uncharacterized protein with von Willebrand factor type A (vWA) domain
MNLEQYEALTDQEKRKLPASILLKIGYQRFLKENQEEASRAETIELKEAEKDLNSPQELFKRGYDQEVPKNQEQDFVSEADFFDAVYKHEKTRRELEQLQKALQKEQKDSLSD